MKRVLGLDLGTTSIGWAVVDQAASQNEKSNIIQLGVRVNPITVDEQSSFENGKSITTTADRTLKRGMRRSLQRYKQRREHLVGLLKKHGIINDDTLLNENGNATTFQTYRLRAKAAHEEISLEEFARVLLMINKKRGYKSNRRADSQEDGELIDGMAVAKKLYNEHLTPGEFAYHILQSGKRFIPSFYRSDLQNEFDKIWNCQNQFYPQVLTAELKDKLTDRSKKDTENIFFAIHHISSATVKDRKTATLTIYKWRVQALRQQLDLEQVVAVLASLNGAIAGASGYLGHISDNSKELYFGHMTVGEYLMRGLEQDPHFRVKNRVFYRQDYLNEFEQIWETQRRFHPELTAELKEKIRDTVIFYQRKLKSQKGLIAYCELEGREITVKVDGKEKRVMTGPKVCPRSMPLYQEFKMWQVINNLRLQSKIDGTQVPLTMEQKKLLHDALNVEGDMQAARVLKVLALKPKDYGINCDEVPGNTTNAVLFKKYKSIVEWTGHDVEKFDKLSASEKIALVESVFKALKFNTDFLGDGCDEQSKAFRLWHLLYSYEGDNSNTGIDKLVDHICSLTALPADYAKAVAQVKFDDDYGSLSAKAIKKILPYMQQGMMYSEACEAAGYRHSKSSLTREEIAAKQLLQHLEVLPKNSLRNPVVEKILNQMVHVVNACQDAYGPFDEIHVEMARELKLTSKQREERTKALNQRTKETEEIRQKLIKDFNVPHPSRNDIIKYRLYMELAPNGFKTLYTDTPISHEKLFTREFNIEHIIPQAKMFDDSFTNKTLETAEANLDKSKMTAYDYVLSRQGEEGAKRYKAKIEKLFGASNPKKCERLLMREADIPDGFLNRDLSDSQYIARKAKEMLGKITRVVVPTTGAITARLREDWQIVDVMKELNLEKYEKLGLVETYSDRDGRCVKRIKDWSKRNDHRHHAMDALAIAFTQPSHIQLLNHLNAHESDDIKANAYALMRRTLTKGGTFIPPMEGFRAEARRHLAAVLVSIKAKNKVVTPHVNRIKGVATHQVTLTPRGQLHNETVYGKRQFYNTKMERVGKNFDVAKIATVCKRAYREALLKRLQQYGGDPAKAFTGKNSLEKEKNPLYLDSRLLETVPISVKTVTVESVYTVRKPIDAKLKLDKVVDAGVRRILQKRVDEYGSVEKAFSNLDENPIWLNKEAGIAIKHVTIKGVNVATALHEKRDNRGQYIEDADGQRQPTDYVSTSNNHHVAIFEDEQGNLHEHIVSFYEAVALAQLGLPIVDKLYNSDKGWKFLYTMKRNELFVVPDLEHGFNPAEIDLMDEKNYPVISRHLYRVQKLATKYYVFRLHLDTKVEEFKALRDIHWKRITKENDLKGFVKVRVDHIGHIVAVGEYN